MAQDSPTILHSTEPVVSIVVPTLNEADNIDRLLEGIRTAMAGLQPYEVLIVDDASRDGTAQRALAWQDRMNVRVIERQAPPDLSGAVLDGARAARAAWVVVMDADGSHPPDRLPALLEPLLAGTHDVTIGSRHAEGGLTEGWPWQRHLTSGVATLLAWPFTEVRDPMAGFFATTRERLLDLKNQTAGYKILLELLVQGGDRIRTLEVPIHFEDRRHGQSKLGLNQQLTYLKRLAWLAGGRVSLGSASKFGLVGLAGMVVDLLLFQLMIGSGSGLGPAHVASFVVATVVNFFLNHGWTFRGQAQASMPLGQRYARFFIVAVMALMIRGGVLVLLVDVFGLSAMAAIVPAILVTAGVNYLGSAFYVFASTASGVIPRVRWHLAALGLLAYMLVLRVLYMGQVDLIPDEMYYWMYAQNLALSYLDHPPLTGWIIAAGTALAGDTVFGVRLFLLPLTLVAAWYFYRYGATMGGKTTGLLCLLAFTVLPFFAVAGILMTPDAPMIAAWAAALYYFKRSLVDGEQTAFLGLGLAMGLGLLAKYTIVLLAPAALVFMLIDHQARRWFFRPQPYLAALLATLIFLPVVVWNWQNDWASFVFQSTRRLVENPDFSSHLVVLYALALLSPVVAVAGFLCFGSIRKTIQPEQRKRRFMLVMTAVPLAVFTAYGAFSVIKFHWTLPPWIAMLPLIMNALAWPIWPERRPVGRLHGLLIRAWSPTVVGLVLAYGLLLHFLTLGLPGLKTTDFGTGYLGWPEIAAELNELEHQVAVAAGKPPLLAAASKWGGAAALAFHHPDGRHNHITGQNLIGMSGSMWEYWFDRDTDPERPVILYNTRSRLINEAWLERALIGLGPLREKPVYRDGQVIQTLYYRIAEGFRPEQVRYPDRIPE
ncbi:glycosyltransferase family 39 protein [Wenzhouxiangella limi]|uniref:Glycosyltransferase n=1 Tax=Wenzhouxiangella limi TaxID=2707351 RepID=A0A845V3P3_9GAMM|nr:glycosyltransferase [Wenzhouxiangella limi]